MTPERDQVELVPNGGWDERILACRCGPLKRLIAPNGTLPLGPRLLLTLFGTVLTPHLAT